MSEPKRTLLYTLKRQALLDALTASQGNRTRAAEKLGITRKTCRAWIKSYGLTDAFPARCGMVHKGGTLRFRPCLRCGKLGREKQRYPGLCERCKRHVDYLDGDGPEYRVHL